MLYVTTRIQGDAFTANRCLNESRGPEGGFFLPMQMPKFDESQIRELGQRSFAANVAGIINLLFNTELDSWAVEFAIGRYPVKLVNVSGRAIIGETWHNPLWRFDRLVKGVEKAIRQSDQINQVPSDWLVIASRIAVLFGIFGEMLRDGMLSMDGPIDVAVASGNFSGVMAAWYAREWGLPIANIVCCCNENAAPWNLLHKGELRTDAAAVRTDTPACDYAVPTDLERLIFHTLGFHETLRYVETCRRGGNYYLERYQSDQLRKGIQVSVVSARRMESTIANLNMTSGYLADPYTALIYSGLIDYRSRTGAMQPALIISDESPVFSVKLIARCLDVTPEEIQERINKA